MSDDYQEKEQVSFNLAKLYAESVFEMLTSARKAYRGGDLGLWFWSLSGLHENIFMLLNPDQQEEIDNLYEVCESKFKYWNKWRKNHEIGEESKKEVLIGKNELAKNCKMYQRVLLDYLKDLGFFPSKTQLSEVRLD